MGVESLGEANLMGFPFVDVLGLVEGDGTHLMNPLWTSDFLVLLT